MNSLNINAFVRINKQSLIKNGEEILVAKAPSSADFLKIIYKNLELSYPKFYKMDLLSKAALLVSEYLFQDQKIDRNSSVIFSNNSASLNTDLDYQRSIQSLNHFVPSPAVFVYTLPNIAIGEICIKHGIQGENIFLVQKEFNAKPLIEAIETQYQLQKANQFLVAWLEINDQEIDVFVCQIDNLKIQNSLPLTEYNFCDIYKNPLKWKI
jgi:hypothetical protein